VIRIPLLASFALVPLGCGGAEPAAVRAPDRGAEDRPDPEGPLTRGDLSQSAIERVVRNRSERFQGCYDAGLKKNPALQGQVLARIVIADDGTVAASEDAGSSMLDTDVVSCVLKGMKKLRFPRPEGGYVTVLYPMKFDLERGGSGVAQSNPDVAENSSSAAQGSAGAAQGSAGAAQGSRVEQGSAGAAQGSPSAAQGSSGSVLKSGPFRGCSTTESVDRDHGGKTVTLDCSGKKLTVTDVPAAASAGAAQEQLSGFEKSLPESVRRKRSTPKISGKSCWATVVQERNKDWGKMVVLPMGKRLTRVVSCSGKSFGISRWCERHITALAKGVSPASLLRGP
jgi:hypothetical protein